MMQKKLGPVLLLPFLLLLLFFSVACGSSDSSSSAPQENPVGDCTSADFDPGDEGMVYALYLIATNANDLGLQGTMADVVNAVENNPDWGGLIHITLTSFARPMQYAAQSRPGCMAHGSDLAADARTMFDAAEPSITGSFDVTQEKWSRNVTSAGSLRLFRITGESTTLHNLLEAARDFELVNLKLPPKILHVSLESSNFTPVEDVIREILSRLNWKICPVYTTFEDHNNHKGRNLQTEVSACIALVNNGL